MITVKDVEEARARIAPHIYRTTLVRSAFLSDLAGADVHLKLECQQRLNAFKVRGVLNRVLTLTPEERRRGVVVPSSGNHGIAASYCGRLWDIEVEVFVPRDTPATKTDKIKYYGGRLNQDGADYNEAFQLAKARAEATGKVLLDPSADPLAAAGHGTVAFEILEDNPLVDDVLVPVGSGGLVTGVGLVMRSRRPGARVYGVQTEASPALLASLTEGVFHEVYPSAPSICEGLTGGIGEICYRQARECLDEAVNAGEEAVRRAVVTLLRYDKVVAEGSGAVGVAYLMEHPERFRGRRVAAIITGGNLDFSVLVQEVRRAVDF